MARTKKSPKIALLIAGVAATRDEVKAVVDQFAANYGYNVADSSDCYPSREHVFFVALADGYTSVDILNSHDDRSLFRYETGGQGT